MIGETETMKKMPDCEEKQGRRVVKKISPGVLQSRHSLPHHLRNRL